MKNVIPGIALLLFAWAAVVGYVMNIVIMFHATELSFTLAARILGIFLFPIGIIAGYL
jgi:hypothetical protein